MGKLTFYNYIQQRKQSRMRYTRVTDLLDDIWYDKAVTPDMTAQEIVNHIRCSGAHGNVMAALTTLVKAYRSYCKEKGMEREEVTIRYVGRLT